ncbi:endonuclease/exonuclease/phosphatase family protein [Streptomyces sp. NPDC012769]|uniref:endonuclease/exonuclease/phosphatase family protein n=1 Tax=Streptomyces sp. NPDC012769 TaxID=3364848 RepID=UPI00369E48B5
MTLAQSALKIISLAVPNGAGLGRAGWIKGRKPVGWFSRVRIALVGSLFATLLPAAAAQADTNDNIYTIWHWNVSGHVLNDGKADTGMVDGAVASIINRDIEFASFNELCHAQWVDLVAKLRAAGWAKNPDNFARFEPSIAANSGVCGEGAYGNAIFSKYELGQAVRIPLPDDPSSEQRNLLCAPVIDRPKTRFCTTHIAPVGNGVTDADKVAQLRAVQVQIDAWATAGETVMIAGDFNVEPHRWTLNTYYSASLASTANSGNTGRFRELDDNDSANCLGYGEWTADDPNVKKSSACTELPLGNENKEKIDYIFVTEASLDAPGSYSADSLAIATNCTQGACSDHRILTGTVTVK